MTDFSRTAAPAPPRPDRPTLRTGWPILASGVTVVVGTVLAHRLTPAEPASELTLLFPLLAVFILAVTLLVLLRIPGAAITGPGVRLAAVTAALVGLLPSDGPADTIPLALWLLSSPWRYALAPLLVHFALALAWPHRAAQWTGLTIGWLVLHALLWLTTLGGLVVGEPALLEAMDETLRQSVLEPGAWLVAVGAGVLALLRPDRSPEQRRAITLGTAALGLSFGPMLIAHLLPRLGVSPGTDTPWEALGLVLFAPLGGLAAISVPRAMVGERDRLGHALALQLLAPRPLHDALTDVAEALRTALEADGIQIQLYHPRTIAAAGREQSFALEPSWLLRAETGDQRRRLSAPINAGGSALGELHLLSRRSGAFGRAEREWLTAILIPMAAAVAAHARTAQATEALAAVQATHADADAALRTALSALPAPARDDGMGVPPPVDAREVLGQLGEGITAAARQGDLADQHAATVRLAARQISDEVARALDTLTALGRDMARLQQVGEEITLSNDTVSAIAFRTNLLANNAALEASRSGAAGGAFGVLAEEIRRLADSTAATSAAIGERTSVLGRDTAALEQAVRQVREVLHAAMTQAEQAEASTRHLHEQVGAVQSTAHALRPALDEAYAVAQRRSARDTHQSAMLMQFLQERHLFAAELRQHRQALDRVLDLLAARTSPPA